MVVLLACAVPAVLLPGSAAAARQRVPTPKLKWQTCTPDGWQCAVATVPRNYSRPTGRRIHLAVTRLPAADQAHKIGSLFVNYGGPGGPAVAQTQQVGRTLFGAFTNRFDIVAFDPRGVGFSSPSIDCHANQETQGLYSQPYMAPSGDLAAYQQRVQGYVNQCVQLNRSIVPYVSTRNVAQDMNLLRRAVGDSKLTYLGFSYGTYLGATYATLFPKHTRALVLDGAVNVDKYATDPMGQLRLQTAAFEHALDRFLFTCTVNPDFCTFTGGGNGLTAYNALVAKADAAPVPASGTDPRPVTGQDVLQGTIVDLYSKFAWPELATALNDMANGDGTLMRTLVDEAYGRNPDGTFDPSLDRYFTISAIDSFGHYSRDPNVYTQAGAQSFADFPHFWFNSGYTELNWGLWPVAPKGVFQGPYRVPKSSATPLVVGTTFDPATPYRGAVATTRQLHNARLLTMNGDGHTAYFGNSECIDSTVDAYIINLRLPPKGTVCEQTVPFPPPPSASTSGMRQRPAQHLHHYQGPGMAPVGRR